MNCLAQLENLISIWKKKKKKTNLVNSERFVIVRFIFDNGFLCFILHDRDDSCFAFVQSSSGAWPIDTISYCLVSRKAIVADFKFPTAPASHYERKIVWKRRKKKENNWINSLHRRRRKHKTQKLKIKEQVNWFKGSIRRIFFILNFFVFFFIPMFLFYLNSRSTRFCWSAWVAFLVSFSWEHRMDVVHGPPHDYVAHSTQT